MSAQNKAIVRRLYDAFNAGDTDAFDEVVSPDFVNHSAPPDVPPTREGWKQVVSMFLTAFPGMQLQIEDEIAEGDLVTTRFTGRGTHQAELMGIPATGKEVHVTGIFIAQIQGEKMVARWEELDMMGLMVQLGVVTPPGG
jgi:steroid delta-isomerase-like uncharacterized protein